MLENVLFRFGLVGRDRERISRLIFTVRILRSWMIRSPNWFLLASSSNAK